MRLPFLSRRRDRSRGQSLVELAVILPVFLLLMLTAIDLGRLLYAQITVTNAAKEGALVASQGGTYQDNQPCADTNEVMCGVLTEADGGFVEVDRTRVDLAPATCVKDAMYPATGSPPSVSVTVQSPFRVLTPIIGQIIGSNLVLNATADAQCLVVPRVTYPSFPDPVAAFTAFPTSGTAPLTVDFDGSGSSSLGATIVSWAWSFGGAGVTPSHTYNTAGSYQVTLTVTDSRGQTDDSDPRTIVVNPGEGGPVCPTLDFTSTQSGAGNGANAHRVDFNGSVTPASSGWTWTYTWTEGALPQSKSSPNGSTQIPFANAGAYDVTLTASKASLPCSIAVTKTVTAP
ncbi:MAG: PKD domain-containing protein [Candidatus Limnocylindrales bacterium]